MQTVKFRINPCPAEWIKKPHPFLIFSQSDYLMKVVDIDSQTEWQTVQIQISWLLQKPTDLDLHCLQRQVISGFSRTKVNKFWKTFDRYNSGSSETGWFRPHHGRNLYVFLPLWKLRASIGSRKASLPTTLPHTPPPPPTHTHTHRDISSNLL